MFCGPLHYFSERSVNTEAIYLNYCTSAPSFLFYVLLQWLTFSPNNSDIFLMGIPNSICHQQKKFVSNQMRNTLKHMNMQKHTQFMSQTLSAVSWLYNNISSTKICGWFRQKLDPPYQISRQPLPLPESIYSGKLGEHHILSFGALTSNSANVL